ncbi:MAG: FecR protein, partial [Chloroflexota bacterium]|nr:FecR protein [Chloroflexota bacterium]
MSITSSKAAPKRRGGYRLIIVLLVVLLLAGAAFFWLNSAAQAAVNAAGTLTVFQPAASIAHNGGTPFPGATGAVIQPGDTIKTDTKGRAALQLPDGTVTRMAGGTEITLTSAHFAKSGNLHDVTISQRVGRTFTNVQHLIGGATFKVAGQSAVASVRGTQFEVLMNADGTMLVKLFVGNLSLIGTNTVNLVAPQQATVSANGNVGPAGPILPDPNDPFGPQMDASNQTSQGTTPGTEQDFIGAPIHNGEQQSYSYSFAGNGIVKAALGYSGSLMALRVKAPDGTIYNKQGPPPVVVLVPTAPAGIYTITVVGVSGLGAAGEEPFVSVASLEPCQTATVAQNGAVRHGYT